MRDKFLTGVIAGGMLGATAGFYALERMSPRQRRKMMRRGSKIVKNASNVIDMIQSANFIR